MRYLLLLCFCFYNLFSRGQIPASKAEELVGNQFSLAPEPAGGLDTFIDRWAKYLDSLVSLKSFDLSKVSKDQWLSFDVEFDGTLRVQNSKMGDNLLIDFFKNENKWLPGVYFGRSHRYRIELLVPKLDQQVSIYNLISSRSFIRLDRYAKGLEDVFLAEKYDDINFNKETVVSVLLQGKTLRYPVVLRGDKSKAEFLINNLNEIKVYSPENERIWLYVD